MKPEKNDENFQNLDFNEATSYLSNKETIRAMFYFFAAKPDSRTQIFERPIHVKVEDILELHRSIEDKLQIHKIEKLVTNFKIIYSNFQIREIDFFQFSEHNWAEPERVDEIIITWDFLLEIERFDMPQRHTLTLRISRDIKPIQLLKMLISGDSDEMEDIDLAAAPAFCRVEFVNTQLGKELINEVKDWYEGRPSPEIVDRFSKYLKSNSHSIALFFDNWFLFSWVLISSSLTLWISRTWLQENLAIDFVAVVLFFAIYSLRPMARLAHSVGGSIYRKIQKLEGDRVTFELTSGDKRKIIDLRNKARQNRNNAILEFVFNSFFNVILNVASSMLYARIFF